MPHAWLLQGDPDTRDRRSGDARCRAMPAMRLRVARARAGRAGRPARRARALAEACSPPTRTTPPPGPISAASATIAATSPARSTRRRARMALDPQQYRRADAARRTGARANMAWSRRCPGSKPRSSSMPVITDALIEYAATLGDVGRYRDMLDADAPRAGRAARQPAGLLSAGGAGRARRQCTILRATLLRAHRRRARRHARRAAARRHARLSRRRL